MRWLAWIAPVLLSSSSLDCFLSSICKTSRRWSSIILFVLSSCSSLSSPGWFIETFHYPWMWLIITHCCNYSLTLIFIGAFGHHILKKFLETLCVTLLFFFATEETCFIVLSESVKSSAMVQPLLVEAGNCTILKMPLLLTKPAFIWLKIQKKKDEMLNFEHYFFSEIFLICFFNDQERFLISWIQLCCLL